MRNRWTDVPISNGALRTVLAVAHSVAGCRRLLDVVDLIERDHRVQVVFTVAPGVFNRDVEQHLYDLGALVAPWPLAVRDRFDLALAADPGGIADLGAPVVLLAPGAGLQPQDLDREGTALPSALVLAHESELDVLRRHCPAALAVAVVAGDLCLDRLVDKMEDRTRHRQDLGIEPGEKLVVVSSSIAFGTLGDVLPRLMNGGRHRVAALLHPRIWAAHGTRQVRAWTSDCRAAGLIVPGPHHDWRAVLAAADHVIGDHGEVIAYAAAAGLPTLRLPGDWPPFPVGSPRFLIGRMTARLRLDRPIAPQLRAAEPLDAVAAAMTSHPGWADERLRRRLYRMLNLAEPPMATSISSSTNMPVSGASAVSAGVSA